MSQDTNGENATNQYRTSRSREQIDRVDRVWGALAPYIDRLSPGQSHWRAIRDAALDNKIDVPNNDAPALPADSQAQMASAWTAVFSAISEVNGGAFPVRHDARGNELTARDAAVEYIRELAQKAEKLDGQNPEYNLLLQRYDHVVIEREHLSRANDNLAKTAAREEQNASMWKADYDNLLVTYNSQDVQAQVHHTALLQVWDALGAADQTDAMIRLRELIRRGTCPGRMTEEQARDTAIRFARMHRPSYYSEPFRPHGWVVDAIMYAANGGPRENVPAQGSPSENTATPSTIDAAIIELSSVDLAFNEAIDTISENGEPDVLSLCTAQEAANRVRTMLHTLKSATPERGVRVINVISNDFAIGEDAARRVRETLVEAMKRNPVNFDEVMSHGGDPNYDENTAVIPPSGLWTWNFGRGAVAMATYVDREGHVCVELHEAETPAEYVGAEVKRKPNSPGVKLHFIDSAAVCAFASRILSMA